MGFEEELKERLEKESGYLVTSYPKLYQKIINEMIKPFRNKNITKVMSPETKGLFYGPTIAYKMKIPFVTIFKSGRVPKEFVVSDSYKDYSNNQKSIDIGRITVTKGDRILLIDDILETGESAKSAIKLIEQLGGRVVGISIVYNKLNKEGEKFFMKFNLKYLVKIN